MTWCDEVDNDDYVVEAYTVIDIVITSMFRRRPLSSRPRRLFHERRRV